MISWLTYVALYGVLFAANKEAAFSNFRLWQSLGFAIPLAYSTFLCIRIKMYILIGILATGMVGYLTIESLEKKKLKRYPDMKNHPANTTTNEDWSYAQVASKEEVELQARS